MIRGVVSAYNNQALQAYKLGFKHPVTSEQVGFEAEISKDINSLISIIEPL